MDELGKSFPAEGMVDAESNITGNPHPNEFCLNCGTRLHDLYCHHCGQKDLPRRQTLGELLSNFISSFWSYEGKFLLTTRYIFTKPGFLAVEYTAGRRESYYHPARMYVFVSFLFFLLFVSLPDSDDDKSDQGIVLTEEDKRDLTKAGVDTTTQIIIDQISGDTTIQRKDGQMNWSFNNGEYKNLEQYDSVQQALPEGKRDNWFERRMQRRALELQKKYNNDANALGRDFLASYGENFSKVLFYLLPFFALVLKLLYIRRDYFYSEHLVLTIYYYNFFYLAGSVIMLINLIPGLGFMSVLLGFWIYFYLLFAMKRMYKQRWSKTILKFMAFSFVFFILMLVGVTINAVATLMSI